MRTGMQRRTLVHALVLATLLGESTSARAWLGYNFDDVNNLLRYNRQNGVRVLDASGLFVGARGAYYAPPIPFEQMPHFLILALVAQEDRCFFDGCFLRIAGLDLQGIGRAVVTAIKNGRVSQGASTITQQVIKEIFLRDRNKIIRKVEEAALAPGLDLSLSKAQIMYLYLNRVYFGSGAYGIEAAARIFFDKPAHRLGLTESALLIQALPAPSAWNVRKNPTLAREKAMRLIGIMQELKYVTPRQAVLAERTKIKVAPDHHAEGGYYPRGISNGWYVRTAENESNGLLQDKSGVRTIRTNLDPGLQQRCQMLLSAAIGKHGKNLKIDSGAIVAMRPSGKILAIIGGPDYQDTQFNAAINAQRQPGSAFKLFVYLAALERGIRPDDFIADDGPITFPSGLTIHNYGDEYRGNISMADALAHSSNVAAVRLIHGHVKDVIELARRLGIEGHLEEADGLALGISEVNLLHLTGAYAAVANGGVFVQPYTTVSTEDNMGNQSEHKSEEKRVVGAKVAGVMRGMLANVVQKGTGVAARPGVWAAGKTGTTTSYRDAWFIGFTQRVVVGVWLGNKQNEPMEKVTGGSLPAVVWREVVRGYH